MKKLYDRYPEATDQYMGAHGITTEEVEAWKRACPAHGPDCEARNLTFKVATTPPNDSAQARAAMKEWMDHEMALRAAGLE